MKSFKRKILLLLGIFAVLHLSLGIVFLVVNASIPAHRTDNLINMKGLEYSRNMIMQLHKIRLKQAEIFVKMNTSHSSPEFKEYLAKVRSFQDNLRLIEGCSSKSCFNRLNDSFTEYLQNFEKVNKLSDKLSIAEFFQIMIPIYDKTENSIINCFNASVKMLQKNSSDLKLFLAKLLYTAMTIFVVSVIYLIIAIVYFFKIILKPITSFHIDFEQRIKSLNPLIFKDVDINDFTQRIDALITWAENVEDSSMKYVISERKRLELLFNSFCDVFIIVDSSLRLRFVNHSAEYIFDLRTEDILGREISEFQEQNELSKKFIPLLYSYFEYMKEHKQPYYKKELMLNNKAYAIEIDCVSNFSQKEGECNSLFLIRFYRLIDDFTT